MSSHNNDVPFILTSCDDVSKVFALDFISIIDVFHVKGSAIGKIHWLEKQKFYLQIKKG